MILRTNAAIRFEIDAILLSDADHNKEYPLSAQPEENLRKKQEQRKLSRIGAACTVCTVLHTTYNTIVHKICMLIQCTDVITGTVVPYRTVRYRTVTLPFTLRSLLALSAINRHADLNRYIYIDFKQIFAWPGQDWKMPFAILALPCKR